MRIIRYTDRNFSRQIEKLKQQTSLFDPAIDARTRSILEGVQSKGDAALLGFTERFDGAKLSAERLAVTKAELMAASLKADASLRQAVAAARRNIEFFARKSLRKDWSARNAQGASVGERFDPFGRVGVYIPGGTAPLLSTALMTVCLARVAGCPEIVVCTPCNAEGHIHPGLLYAARVAGATEIYRVGGAQAIAAMAFGTPTIGRVQKVFGPGNAYVVAAKRLLFGHVSVDLLPGPSEVLVLADPTANARFVAADLLAQAEHGSGHERVWLVTSSAALITRVQKAIDQQLPRLGRRGFIAKVLKRNGWLIQVKDIQQGIELANQFAPEHCEIMARRAAQVGAKIMNAGAVFIGPYSPTVLGDYMAGPSHTLPTGGAGASFPGLTVDQFQRRTSVVTYTKTALRQSIETVRQFAALEGLGAHGQSAEIRLKR